MLREVDLCGPAARRTQRHRFLRVSVILGNLLRIVPEESTYVWLPNADTIAVYGNGGRAAGVSFCLRPATHALRACLLDAPVLVHHSSDCLLRAQWSVHCPTPKLARGHNRGQNATPCATLNCCIVVYIRACCDLPLCSSSSPCAGCTWCIPPRTRLECWRPRAPAPPCSRHCLARRRLSAAWQLRTRVRRSGPTPSHAVCSK